jgi:uncharacterized protein (DUF2141 family)
MFKLVSSSRAAAAALAFAPVAAHATPVGPFASLCASGKPAILARVSGFKAATGTVAVKLYQSGPKFLEKGAYIRKVEVPVTRTGPIDVCVPVPASGNYAISVRHEVKGDKSTADGGGFSGNPKMSVLDVVLKRKPDPKQVTFSVNGTTQVVPVSLRYLQGGSLRPAA